MSKPFRRTVFASLFALSMVVLTYLHGHAVAQEKEKAPEKAAAVTKWEYRIVVMQKHGEEKAEKELNKLGDEGFEIAFATGNPTTEQNARGGPGGFNTSNPVIYYTLKRAKR